MFLSTEKAEIILTKVLHIQEELSSYALAPDRPDLPIETFQHIIGQMYGIKIEKSLVDFDATFVQGLYERYDERAIIYIRKNMPWNNIRFTAIKELCHIVVDEKEDWTPKGTETIGNLLNEFFLGGEDDLSNPVLAAKTSQSEIFAEIAATELLYPRMFRANDKAQLKAGDTTLSKIASYHQVPEYVIGRALSDQYEEAIEPIWERVLA